MLEMLGVLNKEERYQWTIYRSSCEDDVPPSEHIRVVRDKTHPGELEMRHCCQLLDNQTYKPIGLLTLYGDILNLREMRRLLDQHANEVKFLGRVVDCWCFGLQPQKIEHPAPFICTWGTTVDGDRELLDTQVNEAFQRECAEYDDVMDHKELKEKLQAEKLSTGESRFVLDKIEASKVPFWEYRPQKNECEETCEVAWTVVHETDREEMCFAMDMHDMISELIDILAMSDERDAHLPYLAKLLVENLGAQIIGPAGV